MTQTGGAGQHPARDGRQRPPAVPGFPLDDYEDEGDLDAYVKDVVDALAPAHQRAARPARPDLPPAPQVNHHREMSPRPARCPAGTHLGDTAVIVKDPGRARAPSGTCGRTR